MEISGFYHHSTFERNRFVNVSIQSNISRFDLYRGFVVIVVVVVVLLLLLLLVWFGFCRNPTRGLLSFEY